MSLGILGSRKSLGASDSEKYPWLRVSQDTKDLQIQTNIALKAAGYCLIPVHGILDGALCGARNHLTIHSRELFGRDMVFGTPSACKDHTDETWRPQPGCFEPSELKPDQKIGTVATEDWILVGGALSLVLAAGLALTYSK